jgi:hypothetical protein
MAIERANCIKESNDSSMSKKKYREIEYFNGKLK